MIKMRKAIEVLQRVIGFAQFRGAQQEIVGHLMAGGDALVLMPTGAGKSICYQIPALLRNGVGVVVSPLIALMRDQVQALQQIGIRAAFLNSSLDAEAAQQVCRNLLAGQLDILYVAPERLLTSGFINMLEQLQQQHAIALFAIDEAHCVSQWGHDFRPEYRQLTIFHERFPNVPRVALTATADAPTRREIIERLALQSAKQFVSSFDRPNIRYRVQHKHQPKQQLEDFLKSEHPQDAGIVYCLSRRSVDETAAWLQQRGWNALPYHAGLSNEVRNAHQNQFLREEAVIMVATVAFGMGIDKPNVRFVEHLDLPKSMEGYYQETGRAGRDGLPADAWLVYGFGDVVNLRRMVDSGEASEERKRVERQKLNALLGYCESVSCRHQSILRYFGEEHPGHCGQCDNCLTPVATWDATVAVQKALSCVIRTGQRFGVMHLIDVLMGKASSKVQQFHHDRLVTFGVGQELNEWQWNSVFRQLVAAGFLYADMDQYGALKIMQELAKPVLKGQQQVWLRQDIQYQRTKANKTSSKSSLKTFDNPADEALWQALKAKRSELAKLHSVPPYVIFHDSTLLEMVQKKPSHIAQMRTISGVGEAKLARYGEQFVALIQSLDNADIDPAS